MASISNCFGDLCRLCASKVDSLSLNVFEQEQQELFKKICLCLPIQVAQDDRFPKCVCLDCAFKLDMVFEFRERCVFTAQLFEEMISSTDIGAMLSVQDVSIPEAPSNVLPNPEEPKEEILEEEVKKGDVDMNFSMLQEPDVINKLTDISKSENPIAIEKTSTPKKIVHKQKCTECGKVCQSNYKLAEHMRRHTDEKPFKCYFGGCKKTFRSKIGLAQHEASHSGQFDLSCGTCGKGFQCKSYLKVHQRVHSDEKPFCCQQCSQSFKTKQSLLDHTNRHLGVKPYLCDICGRGFTTKGLCKSHQKTHSGSDNRQYPCNVCRKLFVSKSYLRTHFHIHTGKKPFICEVCGKGFLTRVDLKIHSTMHTGEKSFVCETCGKAFARRDALRCHKRSHTGERPYKCSFCGQSFSQFSPMAIHQRLHTGERPYTCNDCPKAFVSKSTLLSHRKKNHDTGAGKMAQALAKGFIAAGLTKGELLSASCAPQDVACADEFRALGAYAGFENRPIVEKSDVVILAVKPQVVNDVLVDVKNVFTKSHTLLSVAMGVTLKQLESGLPSKTRIIRTMPNTPCLVGAGASVYCPGPTATEQDRKMTEKLLSSLGTCEQVPEYLLDIVTALSGSGPAYIYLIIEGMADGAVKMGMPRDLAYRLAAQTVLGAGKMVLETGIHPGQLKDNVMSPAGSTAAALHFLEKSSIRASMMGAIEEATIRCRAESTEKH